MANLTLAQMRARLQEQDSRGKSQTFERDKASYPFWDIPTNSTAVIRYLPDGGNNDFFWVERKMLRMPFPGVKGGDIKPITIQVPCIQMYGKTCPVQAEIKTLGWWNGSEEEKQLASTYWIKRSYIYQGFVVSSPLAEEELPENPIRRFMISAKLHEKTKAAFMNTDIEDLVIDYDNGLDFKITKTKNGQWDSYDTSDFARKTRALSAEERAAIDQFGLFDLKTFLPKEPDDKAVELTMELFEASVNKEMFDTEKFSIFCPNYLKTNSNSTDEEETTSRPVASVKKPVTSMAAKPAQVSPEEPDVEEVESEITTKPVASTQVQTQTPAPKRSAADVLAQLNAKRKAQ